MREKTLRRFVVLVVFVALAGLSAPALAESGPYEGVPAAISLTDSSPERAVLTAASVRAGDLIFCVGPQPPEVAGLAWRRADDPAQLRWETSAAVNGSLQMDVDVDALPLGEMIALGIDRTMSDGSVLQTSRKLIVNTAGVLEEGPTSVARIRRGFRVTPAPGVSLPNDLKYDEAGRALVDAADPNLAFVLAGAREVVPYVTAEVDAGTAVGTVTGSNGQNVPFTDKPCGGAYWGSAVYITSASAGATIIRTDISYRVYHSVDISKFQVAAFRGGITYTQTDYVILYQHSQSGATILNKTHTNLSDYNGRTVNYEYVLGCCNYNNSSYGYLDNWSITLYFTETSSPTIDLVADAVVASPTTVSAGASMSAIFSGHVAGSGTVGGSFGIGFYLSTDNNITTGDVLLQVLTSAWGSVPGDTFGYGSPGVSLTIPGGTSAGNYYLGMIVDNADVIDEANESNNVAWTPITVAAAGALPNIEAVSCSVSPTSTTAGSTVSFTSRGRNSGTVGASAFSWAIYLSTDATINPATDTSLMALDYPGGWNAGADTGDVTRSVPLPSGLADGTYYLGIYYDAFYQVSETNEGDNSCSAAFTIGSGGGGDKIWIVPAAAAAPGFGGANWTGQIAITNPGSAARTATLYYVQKGQQWPGSVLSGPHTIGANQSWFINNPVGSLSPTTGLLYVVFDQWGPRVNSRVYAFSPDGSTYGQGIPGIPMMLGSNGVHVIAPVHSQPGVYHANLGLVHPGTGSYTVEVSIYSSGGSLLGMKSYTRSQAWDQIDNVFADMGLGAVTKTGAWVKVRLTAGSKLWAYISLVDDRTKDPTFLWDLSTLLP